jgi:hypothetical protein
LKFTDDKIVGATGDSFAGREPNRAPIDAARHLVASKCASNQLNEFWYILITYWTGTSPRFGEIILK